MWFTNSSCFLHNTHLLGEIVMKGILRCKMSMVLIRLRAAVQEKALTLGGTRGFQILEDGKGGPRMLEAQSK